MRIEVDYLGNQAIEQGMVVTCFHPDFTFREARTPKNMLGSLVKQHLTGLGQLPGDCTEFVEPEGDR